AFKDVFPRYRTMKGYHVPRIAGWDCHGLPVELAVEKELGFTGKPDIEAYGIGEFNAKCRENVQRHVDAFEAMSERMGYWADYDHAYWTMTADYVESVWWALKQIFDKGLLVEDYRVAPYCPRCGTGLSDHEVAQGYEDVTGLVHQAPAFGADDLAVARAYDLPIVNPITGDGHFEADLALIGGAFFKDADDALVADLKARGLLYRHVPHTHSYPHCWRCH